MSENPLLHCSGICVVAVAFTRPYTPPSIYERPCISCSTTFSYAQRETFHSGRFREIRFSRIVHKAWTNFLFTSHANVKLRALYSWVLPFSAPIDSFTCCYPPPIPRKKTRLLLATTLILFFRPPKR